MPDASENTTVIFLTAVSYGVCSNTYEQESDLLGAGTVGASCGSDQECDGGRCSTKSGKCRGGFGSGCTGNAGCSGESSLLPVHLPALDMLTGLLIGQLSCGNDIENPMCGGEGAVCAVSPLPKLNPSSPSQPPPIRLTSLTRPTFLP